MSRELHAFLIILIIGAATLATRILPVLIFGRKASVPEVILYLGRTVPYAAMGLLIIYCLKDVSLFSSPHGIPEAIGIMVVSISYLLKRNSILSVLIGTVVYMVLVQAVF